VERHDPVSVAPRGFGVVYDDPLTMSPWRLSYAFLCCVPGTFWPAATPRDGFTCVARLDAARGELLQAGFSPATDTPQWLKVSGDVDGSLSLEVYTVYTPDGDGLRFYEGTMRPYAGKPRGWRLTERKVLDEFKEERLPERTWTAARGGWSATIHTRTEDRDLVDMFERSVRKALSDCLDHPGAMGKIQRCRWTHGAEQECQYW
jgi:hypothetical protein